MTTNRPLRVFLCHSSNDKPAVRELYQKLRAEPWIEPWLDEEELFPGMDWNLEIEKAIEATDVILVCLSKNSITKEGYVQREIRIALDYADYKPEGTLFIIPVRLEECTPPKRLARWQYADYYEEQRERGLQRLLASLKKYFEKISSDTTLSIDDQEELETEIKLTFDETVNSPSKVPMKNVSSLINKLTLSNGARFIVEFMFIPGGGFIIGNDNGSNNQHPQHEYHISYFYWTSRFPVTNEQYNYFVASVGRSHPVAGWENKKDHPVTNVSWSDANQYCLWFNKLIKGDMPSGYVFRIPTEAEWEKSARGADGREYPWGNTFDKNKCNSDESHINSTVRVGLNSPLGDSPFGCVDMSGNVWEWTRSKCRIFPYSSKDGREDETGNDARVLRGGSFKYSQQDVQCSSRMWSVPYDRSEDLGFRLVLSLPLYK